MKRPIRLKEQETTARAQKLCRAAAEIGHLRASLHAKGEEISVCTERLVEREGALRELEQPEVDRERAIVEISLANEALDQKDLQQGEEIALLRSQLALRRWSHCPIQTELTDERGPITNRLSHSVFQKSKV